jgi:hypothetical protein
MIVELSTRDRCLQAFHRSGFDSEDAQVQRYAKVQRVVAYFFELGVIGTTTGFAIWGYNDPLRENQAPLPTFFYISASGAGAVLVAIYAIRIKRFCQNREDKPSWALEPLYAVTGASGAALATMLLVKLKAQKMADSINELNQDNSAITQEYEEQINECYQAVYDNRARFTSSDCFVCDLPTTYRGDQIFYQAKPKDWFSQIVCRPDFSYWQPQWESLHNISMNASQSDGLCSDINYEEVSNSTEYSILVYMTNVLHIRPPMEIFVYDLNETCKYLDAKGTEVWYFSSTLCLFHRPFEGACTTQEWSNYSASYLSNVNEMPEYNHYYLPDQVRNLLHDGSLNMQLLTASSVLVFSMLGILGRFLAKRWDCGRSRAEPPLEMVNLNAEGSEEVI